MPHFSFWAYLLSFLCVGLARCVDYIGSLDSSSSALWLVVAVATRHSRFGSYCARCFNAACLVSSFSIGGVLVSHVALLTVVLDVVVLRLRLRWSVSYVSHTVCVVRRLRDAFCRRFCRSEVPPLLLNVCIIHCCFSFVVGFLSYFMSCSVGVSNSVILVFVLGFVII